MVAFLDDIIGLFDDGGEFLTSSFDSIGSGITDLAGGISDAGSGILGGITNLGKGALSILDSGNSIWGSLSGLAGDVLFNGLSIYSAFEASEAAIKAGQSAADVYFDNADIFKDEATNIRQRASYQSDRTRINGLRFLAQQQVGYLKSGVTLEGSPLLVLRETNDLIQLEIDDMLTEAERSATNYEKRATIEEKKAQAVLDEAEFKAQSTLLTSAAKSAQSLFF